MSEHEQLEGIQQLCMSSYILESQLMDFEKTLGFKSYVKTVESHSDIPENYLFVTGCEGSTGLAMKPDSIIITFTKYVRTA